MLVELLFWGKVYSFFGSVSTWKVDPKKTFPVKVILNFLNYVKKGTQGHSNSGAESVCINCDRGC